MRNNYRSEGEGSQIPSLFSFIFGSIFGTVFEVEEEGKREPKREPKSMKQVYNTIQQTSAKLMQHKNSGGSGVHAADPRFHSKDSYGRYIHSKKIYSQWRNLTLNKIQLKNTTGEPLYKENTMKEHRL